MYICMYNIYIYIDSNNLRGRHINLSWFQSDFTFLCFGCSVWYIGAFPGCRTRGSRARNCRAWVLRSAWRLRADWMPSSCDPAGFNRSVVGWYVKGRFWGTEWRHILQMHIYIYHISYIYIYVISYYIYVYNLCTHYVCICCIYA